MPIDPCFEALLADPRNTVRPPPAHVPIAKVRAAANAAMLGAAPATQGDARDLTAPARHGAVPLRLYGGDAARPAPCIVVVHGGGWVWGDLETHDSLCRALGRRAGSAVLSVDYRLAPETLFPGPLDDVLAALDWTAAEGPAHGLDPDRLALFGDSAGGNIAAAAAVAAPARGLRLRHLALAYPAVDPACASPSQQVFAEGPLLTRDAMLWFWNAYLGAAPPARREGYALLEADLAGLPPTSVTTAEHDILRDEGERLAAHAEAAGVPTRLRRAAGMVHGFLTLPVTSPAIEAALADLAADLAAALSAPTEETR